MRAAGVILFFACKGYKNRRIHFHSIRVQAADLIKFSGKPEHHFRMRPSGCREAKSKAQDTKWHYRYGCPSSHKPASLQGQQSSGGLALNVLIVDDEKAIRKGIKRTIGKEFPKIDVNHRVDNTPYIRVERRKAPDVGQMSAPPLITIESSEDYL